MQGTEILEMNDGEGDNQLWYLAVGFSNEAIGSLDKISFIDAVGDKNLVRIGLESWKRRTAHKKFKNSFEEICCKKEQRNRATADGKMWSWMIFFSKMEEITAYFSITRKK